MHATTPSFLTGDGQLSRGTGFQLDHRCIQTPENAWTFLNWKAGKQTPTQRLRLVNLNNYEVDSQSTQHSQLNLSPDMNVRQDPGLLMILSPKRINCRLNLDKRWCRKHHSNKAEGTASRCFITEKNLRALGQKLVKWGGEPKLAQFILHLKKKIKVNQTLMPMHTWKTAKKHKEWNPERQWSLHRNEERRGRT